MQGTYNYLQHWCNCKLLTINITLTVELTKEEIDVKTVGLYWNEIVTLSNKYILNQFILAYDVILCCETKPLPEVAL